MLKCKFTSLSGIVCLIVFPHSYGYSHDILFLLIAKVGMGCKILELDGDETSFRQMYNRPVFMQYNLSGLPSTSSNPENTVAFLLGEDMNKETEAWFEDHALSLLNNYTIFLLYSGSRWYGSIMSPSGEKIPVYVHKMCSNTVLTYSSLLPSLNLPTSSDGKLP